VAGSVRGVDHGPVGGGSLAGPNDDEVSAALTAGLLVAFAPTQAQRLKRLRVVLITQAALAADLHALADRGALAVPNGRLRVPNCRPLLALGLWLGAAPGASSPAA